MSGEVQMVLHVYDSACIIRPALVWPSIRALLDIVKVILGKEDPVAQWKEKVKVYDAKGVQDAIKEVNKEAAKSIQ